MIARPAGGLYIGRCRAGGTVQRPWHGLEPTECDPTQGPQELQALQVWPETETTRPEQGIYEHEPSPLWACLGAGMEMLSL